MKRRRKIAVKILSILNGNKVTVDVQGEIQLSFIQKSI